MVPPSLWSTLSGSSVFNLSALPNNEGLRRQLSSRTALSHAYIISGPAGSGKATLATTLAQAMMCTASGDRPCLTCPQCRKVAGNIHPDLVRLRPLEGKRDIVVEQIRSVRSDTYIRPNEGNRKIYLIEEAPSMNHAAQNALLKVLEEGPAYASFLLIAENAGVLLPTIRSRCETLCLLPPQTQTQELSQEAKTLAHLLLEGDELALMEHCIALEKLDRAQIVATLDMTILSLTQRMKENITIAPKAMKAIAMLKKRREATHFYVSAGHLWGWLCSETFS